MTSSILWEDDYGEVIDRPEQGLIEIRWYDTTKELDASGFQHWLTRFADSVEEAGRAAILTDSTAFRMDMAHMSGDWRDAQIIPRYNKAGITKFAFIMPPGMPAVGAEPTREGPAEYLTAYFDNRRDALRWIATP